MFKVTRLIRFAPDVDESHVLEPFTMRLRDALADAERRIVEPTLPGSRNGGDIMLHAQFRNRESWDAAQPSVDQMLSAAEVDHVDGVDYEPAPARSPGTAGSIYRTLLVAVAPQTPAGIVEEFESDLLLMPRFVDTITACQLSRPSRTFGSSRWSHVFEQEFTTEAGLMGTYLMHPIHWARVDRWFDPECPECIVRERICHSYCRCDEPVLSEPTD